MKVVMDPHWSFDLEKFDFEQYCTEAKVDESGLQVLRRRFEKFCSEVSEKPDSLSPKLSLDDFKQLNTHYRVCRAREEESFFNAMDRRRLGGLCWEDFFMGCSAANPSTPHVLNSITGYTRARYIFDYYNTSRSGTLSYEELAEMLATMKPSIAGDLEERRQQTSQLARALGDVRAVTLRLAGPDGPLCEVRASAWWTGLRVRREIARQLQLPEDGQELLVGDKPLLEEELLGRLVPAGAMAVNVAMPSARWDCWPQPARPSIADEVLGLERLVHVSFQRFYRAVAKQQLPGTSRLFRLQRSLLHSTRCSSVAVQPLPTARAEVKEVGAEGTVQAEAKEAAEVWQSARKAAALGGA